MASDESKLPLTPYLQFLREIIITETSYVDTLFKFDFKYLSPLSLVLSDADHSCVFINFLDLLKLHNAFLIALYDAVGRDFAEGKSLSPKAQACASIAKTFLDNKNDLIQFYSYYVRNIDAALAKLELLTQSDPIFQAKLLECETGEYTLPVLRNMLIRPTQRITQYHLLLNELANHAIKQCEEAQSLDTIVLAQKAVHDSLLHLNEVKRDTEIIQKLKKISFTPLASPTHRFAMQCATSAVVPFEVNDYGKLLADCTVRFSWNCERKLEPAHLFLFQNVVVICDRECNGVYNFRHACHLHEYKAENWKAETTAETNKSYFKLCVAADSKSVANNEYLFRLINKDNVITICSKIESIDSSNSDWIDRINQARDSFFLELSEIPTNHKFRTETFDQPTDCYVCGELLKGLLCQGYKCSQCKGVVHKTCAKNLYDCVQTRSEDFQEFESLCERESSPSNHSTNHKCATNIENSTAPAFTYPEVVAVNPSNNTADVQELQLRLSPYLECLREIVATERSYVDTLFKLESKYLSPLSQVLSDADHNCICVNFLDLLKWHHALLIVLYNAVDRDFVKGKSLSPKAQASAGLAMTFLAFKDDFIQYYSYYMRNIDAASAKLQQLTQNDPIFQAKLLECESGKDSLPVLKDMLICPMQRITKYHQLLDELANHAIKQCEEARGLDTIVLAQKAMHDIILHLHEVKRNSEIQKFKTISFTPLACPTFRFAM